MNEYYKTCAFPKPVTKKKKKKVNGWKGKKDRFCKYCGKSNAERHEVFGGSNRQLSIDKGFQVDVCAEHHGELHANIKSWAQEENLRLYDCESDISNLNYIIDEKGLLVVSGKNGYLLVNEEDIDTFVEELDYLKEEVKRWRKIS